ncbi:MAG: YkoF family thiamine/hydroxymethylpyrimidine-binding protein [Owenweeksia sp.]
MNISLEISMYPLTGEYLTAIDRFLEDLHATNGLKVKTNPMSTQVFGDSALVFNTIQKGVEKVYGELDQCPFVIKVLNKDVSGMKIKDY